MDYQQRLLLQVSYEALTDAGMEIKGSGTGVFIGAFMQDFLTNTMQKENYEKLGGHHATGSSIGMLAARLSYFYDIHTQHDSGYRLFLFSDRAASGGGEHSQRRLRGGALRRSQYHDGNREFYYIEQRRIFIPPGRVVRFWKRSGRLCQGEAAGVLVLKELGQALRDQDRIYCEIIKTAVNHDGSKKGVSYPNGDAQEKLLCQIYGGNGVPIDDIGYLEAHGTGTRPGTERKRKLWRGYSGTGKKYCPSVL